MWIEQSHIWPFTLNITFGWLQKLNPGYEICIISYQVNLSSEVSAMFNSLMPSLNSRSLPFVIFLGGFPNRCQNLSSGAIRPGGLLFRYWGIPIKQVSLSEHTCGTLNLLVACLHCAINVMNMNVDCCYAFKCIDFLWYVFSLWFDLFVCHNMGCIKCCVSSKYLLSSNI